ncbi:uncharacterized protein MONBRDRAFT_31422 [Monosiga brevicollis MX1]|nr:uncharacterized protein MONBRDRAFT_31422 [Monosiga brevicollis MX1]EDQ91172.1 predicted protein [Monosiga brevicollis MX1]|eukprot:XP_001743594.1 hypothetical protein [Monosiga brevicollis MX1]
MSQVINQFALAVAKKFQRRLAFDARFFQPDWTTAAVAAVAAKGSPLPGICAFIDGTGQNLARPKGKDNQAAFYSGKDSKHTTRYQGVVAPNGVLGVPGYSDAHLDVGCRDLAYLNVLTPLGPRHDAYILEQSGLLDNLKRVWPEETPWCLLGDSAYPRSKRLVRPAKRDEGWTATTEALNAELGRLRIVIEWAFGASGYGVASRFEGVVDSRRMLVGERPVSAYMLTAVLLTNMIVCDDQSNPVAQYFGHKLAIPSLTEYMAPLSPSER